MADTAADSENQKRIIPNGPAVARLRQLTLLPADAPRIGWNSGWSGISQTWPSRLRGVFNGTGAMQMARIPDGPARRRH